MFSSTIKRSVATLGVVAGLLAAAGPASAQILDGPVLAKAGPQPEAGGYLATDPSSEVDNQMKYYLESAWPVTVDAGSGDDKVKGPTNATAGGISGEEMANAGKAPASPTSEVFTSVSNVAPLRGDATTIWVWHEAARNGFHYDRDIIERVQAPTNAGMQVGSEGVKDDVPLETVSFTFKGEVIGLEPT